MDVVTSSAKGKERADNGDKQGRQDPCVVCLEPISERAITVPCNHYTFDFVCIATWLQEHSICPLCKTEITAVQYDWRSPTDFTTYGVRSTSEPEKAARRSETDTRRPFQRRALCRRFRPAVRRNPPAPPDIALLQRRHVYRHNLYSLHVGNNRISHYRNITPSVLSKDGELQSRARAFIRRELRVFTYLNPAYSDTNTTASARTSNAEFVLDYIIAILKTVDIKGSSGQAEDMLQEFLGREHARLFLHELNAWLRSPYSRLQDWDRHVQYRERLPMTNFAGGENLTEESGSGRRSRP